MSQSLRDRARGLALEGKAILSKEALKYVILTILTFIGGALLAAISQLFRLSTPLTFDNFWIQFWLLTRSFWQHPFDYTIGLYSKDPIHSLVGLLLSTILVIALVLWRRARRRIKVLGANLNDASVAKALVAQLGIGGRWPHGKNDPGAPWADICKEIQRADNIVLDILGANGIDTFAGLGSPLYDTVRSFTGSARVILLHPLSPELAGRAQSVGMNVRDYRKAVMLSQGRLRELRKQHRAVDGRFYDGQPNWKLILTSRTAWVQYYSPTGQHVNETPMYRFDATGDSASLFNMFHMEFDRIWRRCASSPMKL